MTPKPLTAPTQALLQRLDDGYAGIDADDPSKPWERFWLDLLRDYEAVCAELSTPDTTTVDDTEAQTESEEAA